MRKKNFVLLLLLFLTGLFTIACTGEDEIDDTLSTVEDFRGQISQRDGHSNTNTQQSNEQATEVIKQWSSLFLELERYADGMRPNATARAMAYINLAAYETAVPDMSGYRSNTNHLRGLRLPNNSTIKVNSAAALNACYADVINHFLLNMPSDVRDRINELEASITNEFLSDIPTNLLASSVAWGASIAQSVITYSQTDQAAETQILEPQPLSYEPPTGDGFWTYSAEQERALFPYWGGVRTFIVSTRETSTRAPITYSENHNSAYFAQMQEAYTSNNTARKEDGEYLWIAEFWSDDVTGITFSPAARQLSIANQLIAQYDLSMEETLHLYLKLGFAMNDAAVSTWKYKYEHMVMRPNVFIHQFIDPSFQTNLYRLIPWPNPTFPGYPSGHSCFASAAAGVFIDFFGNETDFTDTSHDGRTEFRGSARSFNSFSDMAKENAYSRIPLGVHIKMDCDEGIRLGYEIADGINNYNLQRDRSL